MNKFILILLVFSLNSCPKKSASEKIEGTWFLIEGPNFPAGKKFDRVIFTSDGNLQFEHDKGSNIMPTTITVTGKFEIDELDKHIQIELLNTTEKYLIVKLDDHEMELRNEKTKLVDRYFRK